MINPEDPRLISLNTERRVTPSDIATNQPFRSNYHLDNSTLVFKHPADTERREWWGGIWARSVFVRALMCVCVCLCVRAWRPRASTGERMDEQNHREKRTQWWPRLVTSAVSSRKTEYKFAHLPSVPLSLRVCRH